MVLRPPRFQRCFVHYTSTMQRGNPHLSEPHHFCEYRIGVDEKRSMVHKYRYPDGFERTNKRGQIPPQAHSRAATRLQSKAAAKPVSSVLETAPSISRRLIQEPQERAFGADSGSRILTRWS